MKRNDIGFQAVLEMAELWQVDDGRVVWHQDGFEWWPGHHRVIVSVSDRVEEDDATNYKLSVSTDFIKSLDLDNPMLPLYLHGLQQTASSYALKLIPQEVREEWEVTGDPMLTLESNVYIRKDNISWMPRFFAGMAILPVIDAQIRAPDIADSLGAEPDTSAPNGGELLDFDEMLFVVRDIYAPEGSKPSKWLGTQEFEEIAAAYGRLESCFGNGDDKGLTLEVPFGTDTALIRLHTDQAHPQLGNGLLATLQLPVWLEDSMSMESNWYNLLEMISFNYTPLMGSWVMHSMSEDQNVVAYSSFIPNLLFQPGLATNMALWMIGRARWARETHFPDMVDEPLEEILRKRYEGLGK
jgi:hypothetical protein